MIAHYFIEDPDFPASEREFWIEFTEVRVLELKEK